MDSPTAASIYRRTLRTDIVVGWMFLWIAGERLEKLQISDWWWNAMFWVVAVGVVLDTILFLGSRITDYNPWETP